MAIQVSGTEVISDARALTNITSIDATTAASISAEIAGIPTGVIAIWSGAVLAIPSGWLICDGANSTPDLRDRFVIGAGSTYAVDATGGATTTASVAAHTHTLSGNTSNSGTHTHTGSTSNTGNHSHTLWHDLMATAKIYLISSQRSTRWQRCSNNTVTLALLQILALTLIPSLLMLVATHTHTLSGNAASTGDASVSILNPYYALCYIMKT
jgi:hypothetical protein